MADVLDQFRRKPAPAADPLAEFRRAPAPPPEEEGGVPGWLKAAGAGAAGLGAIALASKAPGLAGKVGKGVLDLRRMSMLSGLAPLKSVLGNVGGAGYASIERGSMAPIREMLSMETLRDFGRTFKAGPAYEGAGPAEGLSKWNLPGRFMGSADTAAQNALKRAGLSSEEAAQEMLQAPVHGTLTTALSNNPVADYLVPFRRTPINQFTEGIGAFKPSNLQTTGQKVALGTSLATGGATGLEVEDPKAIALGTALSGRRGLPFAMAATAGRMLRTGSKRDAAEAMSGMTPISDYSLSEGVTEPAKIIPKPAAINAYQQLRRMLGLQ